MPQLTWKVDAGQVLTILLVLMGLAVSWGNLGAKIDAQAERINMVQNNQQKVMSDLNSVREEQARVRGILEQHDKDDAAWRSSHDR